MNDTKLDQLNRAKERVDELKWFEAQLTRSAAVYVNGRLFDCESIKLVLLAHVRSELEQAMKYYGEL